MWNSNNVTKPVRIERPGTLSEDYLCNIATWCRNSNTDSWLDFVTTSEAHYIYEYLMYDNIAPIPMALVNRIK